MTLRSGEQPESGTMPRVWKRRSGSNDDAVLASAQKYVQHPDVDAVELASTLRQLREVWCLEGTAIGNKDACHCRRAHPNSMGRINIWHFMRQNWLSNQ
jgi:hypothetical protein